MTGQDWLDKDFYKVLGVSKSVSDAEIKKAYRNLARKLHPDANPGDSAAEEQFKAVSEAYSVLSDPEQRQQYDAFRAMSGGARFTAGQSGHGAGGAPGFEDLLGGLFSQAGGRRPGGYRRQRHDQQVPPEFEEMLGGLFNEAGGPAGTYGGFAGAPQGPMAGKNINAKTTLSFREAAEGAKISLKMKDGSKLTTKIPAGVNDGQIIKVRGKGKSGDPGMPAGDLMITVKVSEHPVFSRNGNNLKVTVPVTFPEAALGADVKVPTLDGLGVTLRLPPGTPSGRTLRAKGHGIKTSSETGDLLATIQIVAPSKLSTKAKQAVEAFASATDDESPRDVLYREAAT